MTLPEAWKPFVKENRNMAAVAELAVVVPMVTSEQLDLVKRTVANGATDAELKLFLYDCARRGIHPLDKLLHFTKRGGKYTPVTSIDFMRSQAAMSGEMAGSDDPVFRDDGFDDGHPSAATVTVYRITQGQRFNYSATARWSEYCPDNAPMWKRMPHTMLGKCAEALALRKAFPQQLAGLYTSDEMEQAGPPTAHVAAPPDSVVDVATGEHVPESEKPAPPKGFHYIASYTLRGEWHEFQINDWDLKGGSMKFATKLKVGELAAQAYQMGVPVRIDDFKAAKRPGESYINKLTLWTAEKPSAPVIEVDASEIAF